MNNMYTPTYIKRENQFTNGNEYMDSRSPVIEGESIGYIGYYNITAEGPFTDRVYTLKSKPLFPIKVVNSKETSIYVELISNKGKKTDLDYSDPLISTTLPVIKDKKRGFILRYFIQQRNDNNARIKEVNKKQYDDLLKTDKGINPNFYKGVTVKWKIIGPMNDVLRGNIIAIPGIEDTNKRTLTEKEFFMKGISLVLSNRLLQYSEYDSLNRNTNTDIQL
tara:strand:+ start:236 stop:898 length:663 start_codon:yes stop_codon:yes gene_type:complete